MNVQRSNPTRPDDFDYRIIVALRMAVQTGQDGIADELEDLILARTEAFEERARELGVEV